MMHVGAMLDGMSTDPTDHGRWQTGIVGAVGAERIFRNDLA